MKLRYITAIIILVSTFGAIVASNVSKLPIRKVGDISYYVYDIEKRESVYAVSKKLDISVDELLKYNPSAEDGLNKGQKLFFPVPNSANIITQSSGKQDIKAEDVTENPSAHLVMAGETLYGISKKYNVTQEQIITLNPQIASGLKAGEQLVIPAANNKVYTSVDDSSVIYHTLQSGETLYRLTLKYSTTLDEILKLNPGLSPDNYKVDDVIRIKTNTLAGENIEPTTVTGFIAHKADRGDSFESIANDYGVTEELVKETNQELDDVKRGKYVYIPTQIENSVDTVKMELESELQLDSIYTTLQRTVDEVINIALIFPFALDRETIGAESSYFTEFYKGFLLAVDTLSAQLEREINIYVYDSEAKNVTVVGILNESIMKDMDIIFTPNNITDINLISDFANKNNINVANIFSTKSENYVEDKNFFQANIPQSYMLSKTVDYVHENFSDYKFVFINDSTAADEKAIIQNLRELASEQVELEISIDNQIVGLDSILSNTNQKVLLIPNSASKLTLMKILLDLDVIKGGTYNSNFAMLGHPEWVTYSDMFNYFYRYNCYIYSRFFVNEKEPRYIDFEKRFKDTYGMDMKKSSPNFALLGFDSALYYLNALDKQGGDFNDYHEIYKGVQNDYLFNRVNNWGGFINQAMLIINFRPDRKINRITIY